MCDHPLINYSVGVIACECDRQHGFTGNKACLQHCKIFYSKALLKPLSAPKKSFWCCCFMLMFELHWAEWCVILDGCFHIQLLRRRSLSVLTLNLTLRHVGASRILWHPNPFKSQSRSYMQFTKCDMETWHALRKDFPVKKLCPVD